jgi:TolA-binding protein
MIKKSLLGLSLIVSLQANNVNEIVSGDVSLSRKVDLLEQAVIKLIKRNNELERKSNELEQQNNKLEQHIKMLKIDVNTNKNIIIFNSSKIKEINSLISILQKKIIDITNNKLAYFAIINATKLNIREEPTLKAKIVGIALKGEIYKISDIQQSDNRTWYKIKKGWISSNYAGLILTPNLKELKNKQSLNLDKNNSLKVETNSTITIENNATKIQKKDTNETLK